ncbi:NFATC2-interacting protein [Astyanax mexicanus]|uniref:NFATC2-interacting protein n=1 Tax=Astyanax mexicanus TaxID=7994 RepID=A0A8T2L0J5_ASTMX|nr:NFATC2-interacting protein [Astyanax mexicanus]
MAEVISDSDSDGEVRTTRRPNPPAKRRRVIDPSAITSVPIYSNKVNSSLQLKPAVFKQVDPTDGDEEEARLWSPSPPKTKQQPTAITLSDSEDESEQPEQKSQNQKQDTLQSPSPPPPTFSPGRRTRRADKKIREINRRLEVIDSLLCPSPEREDDDDPGYSDCSSSGNDLDDDDDIIIVSNEDKQKRRAPRPEPRGPAREISLKFRWRTDVHRIPLLSTAPLSQAVDQLSAKLKVPPSQILLLKQETELPTQSTLAELGLGIADIIDCVVVTEDKEEENSSRDLITVRLQGKEKGSAQEYSLHKDDPLGSILTQYTSGLSAAAKRKVKFLFDGSKVTPNQTPSQLDMENGDVIEVWN